MSIIEQSKYTIIGYKLDENCEVCDSAILYRGDIMPKSLDFGGLIYYDEISLYKRVATFNKKGQKDEWRS